MRCRRDMEIPNRETFLLAYRELLENEIISEEKPGKMVKFKYSDDYKYTKLRQVDKEVIKPRKRSKK